MHKDRLDNEFWLLQKLATVMEKANFHELSKPLVQQSLAGHLSREGIIVSKGSYINLVVGSASHWFSNHLLGISQGKVS